MSVDSRRCICACAGAQESSVARASVLAFLLVCALALSTGTVTAQTVSVSSLDDFQDIPDDPDGNYVLAGDINASGEVGFEPVGDEGEPFTGTFDGNGHTVTSLTVNRPDEEYVGLFGYVGSGGTVTNVGLKEIDMTGGDSVGGVVGYNEGRVRRSHATGRVVGTGSVGGLVGSNIGVVTESYANVEVRGEDNVGGLVGRNSATGKVSESYAEGRVNGTEDAGGAVGSNGGEVTDSYSTGDVDGESTLGGFVGANSGGTVRRSYSTGAVSGAPASGGFVGSNNGEVIESYWNTDTANQGGSSAGVPLSTEQMTDVNALRNMEMDFGGTWVRENEGYPTLAWEVDGRETGTDGRGGTGDGSSEDATDETEGMDEEDESPDEGLPGFGALVAVAAVLVGGAVLRRRR